MAVLDRNVGPRDALRVAPKRPVKVQISLSFDERVRLTELARQRGYPSVAEFVRAATLKGQAPS